MQKKIQIGPSERISEDHMQEMFVIYLCYIYCNMYGHLKTETFQDLGSNIAIIFQ